ncbi:MAG: hypothetical protein ACLPPF_03020 [Rhodomicrobium sp.]
MAKRPAETVGTGCIETARDRGMRLCMFLRRGSGNECAGLLFRLLFPVRHHHRQKRLAKDLTDWTADITP